MQLQFFNDSIPRKDPDRQKNKQRKRSNSGNQWGSRNREDSEKNALEQYTKIINVIMILHFKKIEKKPIEVKRLRILATAIFKPLNPHCMNDILKPKVKSKARTNDILEILSKVLKA